MRQSYEQQQRPLMNLSESIFRLTALELEFGELLNELLLRFVPVLQLTLELLLNRNTGITAAVNARVG